MGRKLYVANLAYEVTSDDLRELFATVGTCESASVINDRDTGRSRGFGFVEMSAEAEAAKAIQQLNQTDFKGRLLRVDQANERAGGGGGNRGGGGGYRGGNGSRGGY